LPLKRSGIFSPDSQQGRRERAREISLEKFVHETRCLAMDPAAARTYHHADFHVTNFAFEHSYLVLEDNDGFA
jgi:hypothetical protein